MKSIFRTIRKLFADYSEYPVIAFDPHAPGCIIRMRAMEHKLKERSEESETQKM